jgi:hypothetical protein
MIAWLESKDSKATYEWLSEDCLYGQFCKETGASWGDRFDELHYYPVAYPEPRTFGAALERARKFESN